MLGHWDRAKDIVEILTAEQKRAVLEPLAEGMMKREILEIETQEALELIKPHLELIGAQQAEKECFLPSIQAGAGLLVEREAGKWGFAHFTFQEYLCASHWRQTGKAKDWGEREWLPLIASSWWPETLRLYAAQADANSLVTSCLELNTTPALELAGNIAREALKLESGLRESIKSLAKERAVLRLRSKPLTLTEKDDFKALFNLDENLRPLAYIQNDYERKGDVVIDHATGLTWQQAGSETYLTYEETLAYVEEQNAEKYGGFNDWRLPTVEELASLLEPEKQANDLYIHPVFNSKQRWCWTSDQYGSSGACLIGFYYGDVSRDGLDNCYYVRLVRP